MRSAPATWLGIPRPFRRAYSASSRDLTPSRMSGPTKFTSALHSVIGDNAVMFSGDIYYNLAVPKQMGDHGSRRAQQFRAYLPPVWESDPDPRGTSTMSPMMIWPAFWKK